MCIDGESSGRDTSNDYHVATTSVPVQPIGMFIPIKGGMRVIERSHFGLYL